MKRFTRLMLMFLAGGIMFTACNDDDADPQVDPPRIIDFTVNGETSGHNETGEHTVGDTIVFQFRALSDGELDNYTISELNGGANQIHSGELSGTNQLVTPFEYVLEEGINRMQFDVYDTDGQRGRLLYIIDSQEDVFVNEATVVLLGGDQHEAEPSFYDAEGLQGYMVAGANNNQEIIDFVYFYGNTLRATIAAPSTDEAAQFEIYNLNNWNTRNETDFKSVNTTLFSYDDVETNNDVRLIWDASGGINNPKLADDLVVGDLIAFRTVNGRHGIFEVEALQVGRDGTITLNVKVESE